jgi:uncharacterized membrane protein YhhN
LWREKYFGGFFMLLYIYIFVFTVFSVLFILIKSLKQNEPVYNHEFIEKLIPLDKLIKIIPAGSAILFVLLSQNKSFYFSIVLSAALVFCLLGDLGMEKGIIPGLPLFLIAQLLFIISFLGQSLVVGIDIEAILIMLIVAGLFAFYLYFFIKYLNSSEKSLGELLIPVIIYCIFISGMVVSIVLVWFSSGLIEFSIVFLGGIMFVISDSTIAVREFHHDISNNVVKVMFTYYLAIFLLSLASLIPLG